MSHNKNGVAHTDMTGKGFVDRYCPQKILPYAHLARWDRPIGTWLVLFPGWWMLALASGGGVGFALSASLLKLFAIFAAGAFLIRGAGCTVNDLWDRDIDGHVERTQNRPIPSGRVGVKQAIVFAALQFLLGFVLLLQLNTLTIVLGFISVVPICIYPLMKRVTWWPQLALGLVFNFSALMGWAAVQGALAWQVFLVYIGCVCWTIGYDTIYAHQDKEDDAKLGMKSTALLFKGKSRMIVTAFYTVTMLCLGIVAFDMLENPFFVLFPFLHLLWQVTVWDLDDQDSCLKVFKANRFFGWLMLAVFMMG